MKKAARETKTAASPKLSIEKLKAMSNKEYTEQLAREMVDSLNAARKRRNVVSQSQPGKHK